MNDSTEHGWVLFRDRSDWQDVIPVSQNDGPHSVVSIAYSEKYRDVYDYLRGIIKLKEKSERALELTQFALQLNPGNYSIWQLRRDIIRHLDKDIKKELDYTEQVMKNAEKNYQVWHHRRVLVEWSKDASQENRVTARFLMSDPKNYHAWQHRQWYMRTFNLYDQELDLVDELLADDVRNNSAWNQRYFVINNTSEWTESVIQSEVAYTMEKIKLSRRNESSWNYLRGVMYHAEPDAKVHSEVKDFCESLFSNGDRSPYLIAYIIDMCDDAVGRDVRIPGLSAERAEELCDILASDLDQIRCQYWNYMKNCIRLKAERYRQLPGNNE